MDIVPNIGDGYTLELASQNDKQYRDAYQSVRSIDNETVASCRVSHCTGFLLHCLSGKKDLITVSTSMIKSLKTTIENTTKPEIAWPNS